MRKVKITSEGKPLEELLIIEFLYRGTWFTSKHLGYRLSIDCDPPVYASTRKVSSTLLSLYNRGYLYRRPSARGDDRFSYKLIR